MSDEKDITAVVHLTVRDLYKANVSVWRSRRSFKWWIVFTVICMALSAVLFHFSMARWDADPSWLAASMLGVGVVLGVDLVLWPLLLGSVHGFAYLAARNVLRSKPVAAGPFTYVFSSRGLSYSGPTGSGHIEWITYLRIQETSEQFLLYVQNAFASVLPKKAFETEESIQGFRQLIRECFHGDVKLLK